MKTRRDWDRVFLEDRDADTAAERHLLVKEAAILVVIAALIFLRQALL